MKTLEQTIVAMLTENTGTHFLDSGGAGGRAWQRNQGCDVDYFRNTAPATIKFYDVEDSWPEVTVSLFHKLTSGILELDEFCHRFNAIEVGKWNGQYVGTDSEGSGLLDDMGLKAEGDIFNTYNWDNHFSQVIQGYFLKNPDDEDYVLLQIHGGADIRGGYTDAKLFRINDHEEPYSLLRDDCHFSIADMSIDTETKDLLDGSTRNGSFVLSWSGEWFNEDGGCANDDDFKKFAILSDCKEIEGVAY